jgi:hypothetical protein
LENNEEDEEEEDVKYEITIKKGLKPTKKELQGTFYTIKSQDKNKNKDPSEINMKAQYIPPDYNFKFFKPKDKGLMKKIERDKIPFDVDPDTNYLIERRKGIDYPEDYLDGPYFPEQNLVIITDSKNKNPVRLAKLLKDEKMMKKKMNTTKSKNINLDEIKTNLNSSISERKSYKTKITANDTKTNFYNPKAINERSFVSIKRVNVNDIPLEESKSILEELEGEKETKIIDDFTSIFSLIKREHILLRVNYKIYAKKIHPYYLYIFFAEIFDKIYIVKILLFLKITDVFSVHFSLYVFCHILLLAILCNFFTINLIRKIWETTDFPNLRFYLLYGLIANLIIWVIYQLFLCLIDFDGAIKDLAATKKNMQKDADIDSYSMSESNENKLYDKFKCLMRLIRLRVSILHILTFLIALCCGIYLISFFALYTGTKSLVFKIYYISIIEIVVIKIAYGIILASLRIISIEAELKTLYYLVYILDKYFS